MIVQGFIFNWKGHAQRAAALEADIGHFMDVTVISSDEGLEPAFPHWRHLDDTAYFAAQWNRALTLFHADALFHIQADARPEDFGLMLARATTLLEDGRVGVYEPYVDYSDIQYDLSTLRPFEDGVYEVPLTDCTCWFIAGDIVRKFPPVDLSLNKYGWGATGVVAALCKLQQKACVRDYRVKVVHPRVRGYPPRDALLQRDAYVQTLEPGLRACTLAVYEQRRKLRPMFTAAPPPFGRCPAG